VRWLLSLPALVALGWVMGGLLWWHRRRGVIADAMLPWAMTGMALVAVAMALLLATLPAPAGEQVVRAALLVEGVTGFWLLARYAQSRSRSGRR
jgi:hypothetical protein